jgi:Type II CAAX prenyl endopeptidase Rce1-like
MARKKPDLFEPRRNSYRWQTHRPLNCLAIALPLLVVYHVGSAFSETTLFVSRDLRRMLGVFGQAGWYLPPVLVIVAVLLQHIARRDPWRIRPGVVAGMLLESLAWTLPLLAANYLCQLLLDSSAILAASSQWPRLLVAIGAGVYEEFIFRFLLLGTVIWIFASGFSLKREFVVLAALAFSAATFSLYHFSFSPDSAGPAFTWGMFIFRAVAGLALGLVYVGRGFGIAVGAHTFWNLYVVIASS